MRGQQRRLLRARRHQGRCGLPRPAVRALPLARARRPARHRPRHRDGPAGGGHPVRLRPLRPPPHGPGGQRHHLPGPLGRAGHGQGPRLRARPAGRLVQAGRRLGAGGGHRGPTGSQWPARPRHPGQRAGAGQAGGGLPPPPRHPLGGHGHLRPAGHRGVPGGVGPHGGPQRPAVGQGRLRGRRPGEVRPAGPRDALRPALRRRPHPRAPGLRGRPGRHPPGGRGLRHALPGRLRRRVPGGEPGPDGHPAPATPPHVLRPGGGGGPHPSRAHPGRLGAPLHPAPQRPGARHLPAPAAREQPGQDPRRAAVPGAAHADGHRRGRLHPGRGRPAAPGHGLQAQPGPHGAAARSGSTRAWPSGASPGTSPTRSS